MPLSDVAEAALLDYFINTYLPNPAYLGLSSTTPTAGTGASFTEPVGNGYGRAAIAPAKWAAAVGGAPSQKLISATVAFPVAAGGSWAGGVNLTYFGIFSVISGGTPVAWDPLDVARAVLNGQQFQFDLNNLRIKWGAGTPT